MRAEQQPFVAIKNADPFFFLKNGSQKPLKLLSLQIPNKRSLAHVKHIASLKKIIHPPRLGQPNGASSPHKPQSARLRKLDIRMVAKEPRLNNFPHVSSHAYACGARCSAGDVQRSRQIGAITLKGSLHPRPACVSILSGCVIDFC